MINQRMYTPIYHALISYFFLQISAVFLHFDLPRLPPLQIPKLLSLLNYDRENVKLELSDPQNF